MKKERPKEGSALPKVMQQVCESRCQKPGRSLPTRPGLGSSELQGLLIETGFCKVLFEHSGETGSRAVKFVSVGDPGQEHPSCITALPVLCTP
jgi:hypothetical protein